MVTIKVNDSGECRVTVKGPWDTVKKNLEIAASKVREMANDSRRFASITEGTYAPPMRPQMQPTRPPREEPREGYPARQPQISRPASAERPAGGAA